MKTRTEPWQRSLKKEHLKGWLEEKICRQIQQSIAKSLKKLRGGEKKGKRSRYGRTLLLFCSTGNSKTCQTKWHHSLSTGGRAGWERRKGETAPSESTEKDKWAQRTWETETRETYKDNNEADWQMCGTVQTFRMSESKKQTCNWRLSESHCVKCNDV